jgi:hypothetical protein
MCLRRWISSSIVTVWRTYLGFWISHNKKQANQKILLESNAQCLNRTLMIVSCRLIRFQRSRTSFLLHASISSHQAGIFSAAMLPKQTREQDLAHNQKFDGSVVGVFHVVDQKLYRRIAQTFYGSILTGFRGFAHNTN